ncbi:MAG: excinuclease ABC subunit UvrC [Candidatus Omnitrophica bacterium]|nr:excinuclease ABC subunit UvrC [Candidatus Omnitrophota bacterium]
MQVRDIGNMDAGLKEKISSLPLTSGVYLMKDAGGNVIYVGKAVSLRRRVQSYFRGKTHNVKTDLLVSNITDVDYISTHSEAEALILEAALVKQYQPRYNIELKDGKSYPFIEITGEEFPRISVVRIASPEQRKSGCFYFGPYVDAALIREALTIIRKIFPYRTCDPFPRKSCLYYSLGLCDAPCIGEISPQDYHRNIKSIVMILEGHKDELYKTLKEEMEYLASIKEFEAAANLRDQLRAIGALYSSTGELNYFKEAEQLERILTLKRMPDRIECIDISTIMGELSVGSLVSFFNGKPDKANYRRFRIKEVKGIDDVRMVAEVVRRRYGRLKREAKAFPDLIVIDGGLGQLGAAAAELKALGCDIPVISLAKREEEVFVPGKRASILLSKDSLALKLLQRVRDEAHRFAISYHRKLRDKKVFE